MTRFTIGLMSGTSMDGIDCALVDENNLFVAGMTYPYPDPLKQQIKAISTQDALAIAELMAVNTLIGQAFAKAVMSFLETNKLSKNDIVVIGSHGQTIAHDTHAKIPYTLQLGCPHTIAQCCQIPVIADFRTRDMVLGGQGAPFAPWYHEQIFKYVAKPLAVVNMGGIANITFLSDDMTIGYDTGPGNCLMDDWVQRHFSLAYDEEGRIASSGQVIPQLLNLLMRDEYFHRKLPKSIGKEYFSLDWLQAHLSGQESIADIQATLLHLTAVSIQQAVHQLAQPVQQLILCGGGVHNRQLVACLKDLLAPINVQSSDFFAVSPDYMEAMMMAWLARQAFNRIPIDMRMITGAETKAFLGAYYPAG